MTSPRPPFTARRGWLATPLLALALLGGPARASAQSPFVAVAIDVIAPYTQRSHEYTPYDYLPPSTTDRGQVDGWNAGGSARLVLGARLGDHVAVGGFFRLTGLGMPRSPFETAMEPALTLDLGPELRVGPKPGRRGPYVDVRGGYAFSLDSPRGFDVAFDAGVELPLGEASAIAIGLGLVYQAFYWGEDGDHGRYDYTDRIVSPAVVLTFVAL